MIRTICTLAFLAIAMAARADPLTLHSTYDVAGTNPDGSKYAGKAAIKVISEASFTIKWTIGGTLYDGFGMRNDDALAATYTIDGKPGLVIYKVDADGVLHGVWVVRGENDGKRLGHCPFGGLLVPCRGAGRPSARELKAFGFRLEARAKNLGIERILEAVADERRIVVLHIHVELADIPDEEVHDLAVVGELTPRQHHLMRALFIELAQPRASLVRIHCLSALDPNR
jgi:hypothetical protein